MTWNYNGIKFDITHSNNNLQRDQWSWICDNLAKRGSNNLTVYLMGMALPMGCIGGDFLRNDGICLLISWFSYLVTRFSTVCWYTAPRSMLELGGAPLLCCAWGWQLWQLAWQLSDSLPGDAAGGAGEGGEAAPRAHHRHWGPLKHG